MQHDYSAARERLSELGIPTKNWTNVVLVAEALARGIQVDKPAKGGGVLLTHGEKKHRYWLNGYVTLNTALSRRVVAYKDVLSRLLQDMGVHAPENGVFEADRVERAWSWAQPLLPVVLKPHIGAGGKDVFVEVNTREEFDEAFHTIACNGGTVLVEQFFGGSEHRCVVIDNKFVAAVWRRPANVLGDGTLTVRQLVEAKNAHREVAHKPLKLGEPELKMLTKAGMTPDSVPGAGQRAYLRANSNMSTGGDAIDATEMLSESEIAYAEQVAKAIPGLRLAALDVMLPRDGYGSQPAVVEVNGSPGFHGHHFPVEGQPRDVAGAILDAMFPATKTEG